ncbi:MAG: hypothetical protein LBM99_01680 [Bacillales bacterium]|jgi:hypothetical protein|nr:hypothetical protein [Bacillales bacterium]
MKKILKVILNCLLTIIILMVIFLELPFSFGSSKFNADYTNIINESVSNVEARIVDIKMLGAHDAFTDKLNLFSANDENAEPGITNEWPSYFIRGLITRMAKAQNIGSTAMLKAGVRYFDIRASYHKSEWQTTHAYISDKLENYLRPIIEFLHSNNGEVVILDFQEIHLNTLNIVDFIDYLSNVKVNDKNIFDFVTYDVSVPIKDLTYKDVTSNKSKSGAVLLFYNQEQNAEHPYYYQRNETTISKWHDKMDNKEMFSCIESEYNRILEDESNLDLIRINQAQKTFAIGLKMFTNWSLITMADSLNGEYIKKIDQTSKWFEAMPIFMVDHVNSNSHNFNKVINETIIELNKNL